MYSIVLDMKKQKNSVLDFVGSVEYTINLKPLINYLSNNFYKHLTFCSKYSPLLIEINDLGKSLVLQAPLRKSQRNVLFQAIL